MIIKSDNLHDILNWLSPRMKPYQKRELFRDLKVSNVKELEDRWSEKEVKDRINLEVQRHATVADCTFKLETFSNTKYNKPFKTFVDMSSTDN